jgi:hypothetical protein
VRVRAPKDTAQAKLYRRPAQLLLGQLYILERQQHHAEQAVRGDGTVVGEPVIVGSAECCSKLRIQIIIPAEAEARSAEEDGDVDALPVQIVQVGLARKAAGDGVAESAPPGRVGDAGPDGIGRLHQPADIVSEGPVQIPLPQISWLHNVPITIDDPEAVAHVEPSCCAGCPSRLSRGRLPQPLWRPYPTPSYGTCLAPCASHRVSRGTGALRGDRTRDVLRPRGDRRPRCWNTGLCHTFAILRQHATIAFWKHTS